MYSHLFIFLSFLLLFGCSSSQHIDPSDVLNKKNDKKTQERNKKLLESFEVEKEFFKDFEVKEVAAKESSSNQPAKKTVDSKPTKVVPPVPQKLTKNKTTENKTVAEKTAAPPSTNLKKSESRPIEENPQDSSLPEDYPEAYQEINAEASSFLNDLNYIYEEGELSTYEVKYLGVTTGNVTLKAVGKKMMGTDQMVFHYQAYMKSSSYYSYLYEIDDRIDTFVDVVSHVPLKYSLIQRESGQDIDDLQLFDLKNLKVKTFFQRKTKDKVKKKNEEFYIPLWFQDPLSMVYYLKFLPYEKGRQWRLPLINKGKLNWVTLKVLGEEVLETEVGSFSSWKISIETSDNVQRLKHNNMIVWYAKEGARQLLKFSAKISIGSVTGEIIEFSRGSKVVTYLKRKK